MFLCIIFLIIIEQAWGQGPIVETLSGEVQGRVMYDNQDRRYEDYLGIPYAQAPIGDFRFTKPEIPLPWSTTKDATEFGDTCYQIAAPLHEIIGLASESEDCLFVNVHVPGGVEEIGDDKKPVMVWIYGGAWYIGTSDMYPGQDLALNGDVIVVSFNYRLSSLGWLSTQNSAASGNWGLWDGYYALLWVQGNIARFGGDPSRVTLMGQSAGSASVSHHLNSPYAQPLFHRAIEMSGSSGSWFGSTALAASSTRAMALPFLCPTNSDSAMLSCLREREAQALDFVSIVAPVVSNGIFPNMVPVVDYDYVPRHPRDSISSGSTAGHDLITGWTRDDGFGLVTLNPLGMGYGKLLSTVNTRLGWRALLFVAMNVYDNPRELVGILYEKYPDMDSFDTDVRTKAAAQMITDFAFAAPSYNEAENHALNAQSTGKKTWLYEYAYRMSFFKYESWVNGSHVDDCYTVFGEPFLETFVSKILREDGWNDEDRAMSAIHQKYFANFAYTGDPNDGPHSVDTEWPEYTADNRDYLLLGRYPEQKNLDLEIDRLEMFQYFSETWPSLLEPRTMSNDITSFGENTISVRIALDSILDNMDMDEAMSNPVTKIWVEALINLRSRIYV